MNLKAIINQIPSISWRSSDCDPSALPRDDENPPFSSIWRSSDCDPSAWPRDDENSPRKKCCLALSLLFLGAFATSSQAASHPSTGGVDVYFSVVDEEAAGTLSMIFQNSDNANARILLIERDHASGGFSPGDSSLFQKPLPFYSPNLKPTLVDSTGTDSLSKLGATIQNCKISPGKLEEDRFADQSVRLGKNGCVSLLVLQNPSQATQTIILYRVPELGLQPILAEKYTRSMLNGIRTYADEISGSNQPLCVHMMTTAGAVDQCIAPGTRQAVSGSFYVGCNKRSANGSSSFFPVICYADSCQDQVIYEGPALTSNREALAYIQDYWKELASARDCVSSHQHHRAVLSKIDAILANSPTNTLTQTVPFFDDAQFKQLSNIVFDGKVAAVDMEDYEILKALIGIDGIKIAAFERFITNAKIPQSFKTAFAKWYTDPARAHMSETRYQEAILWGLEGADPVKIPESARWNIYASADDESLLRETGVSVKIGESGRSGLIDPYYAEIASDFLRDLFPNGALPGKAFPPIDELLMRNNLHKLDPLTTERLKNKIIAKELAIGKFAETIVAQCSPPPPNEMKCPSMVAEIVRETGSFQLHTDEGEDFADSPLSDSISKAGGIRFLKAKLSSQRPADWLEIWVRKGKWEYAGTHSQKTFASDLIPHVENLPLPEEELANLGGAFDRMFYKGALIGISRGLLVYEKIHEPR